MMRAGRGFTAPLVFSTMECRGWSRADAGCTRVKRYNPHKRDALRKMMAMRLGWLISAVVCGFCLPAGPAQPPSQWEQPAAALAEQINAILGPGQAQLTLRNISTIAPDDVAQIDRKSTRLN